MNEEKKQKTIKRLKSKLALKYKEYEDMRIEIAEIVGEIKRYETKTSK